MADIMRPVPFSELLKRITGEYRKTQTLFGIPARQFFKKENTSNIRVFGEACTTPIGPAAGPHTQLTQNIITSWITGARFIELKTVQKLDQLEVSKPCIDPEDEAFNCEWSTEFTLVKAYDEYIKAWFILHALEELFTMEMPSASFGVGISRSRLLDPQMDGGKSFIFNMSVGYDLEGIKTPPMQFFIDHMLDASDHPLMEQYRQELTEWLGSAEFLSTFNCAERRDELLKVPARVPAQMCKSLTLSTMHGCPPHEIEQICHYMLTEKGINTFVKLNPTLLGFDTVRGILDHLGFTKVELKEESFSHDLQMSDALPMLERLLKAAKDHGRGFGVKLTNTLGSVNNRGRLPDAEMYMSGRALYPLTITLAAKLARVFQGQLPMSYSGGAWKGNVAAIFSTGIRPITMATDLLKPGGYLRLRDCAKELEATEAWGMDAIDVEAVEKLAAYATSGEDPYTRKDWHTTPNRKEGDSPLTDCFIAPCKEACPIHQDIPEYIQLVAKGQHRDALALIYSKNALPGITGHICDHQCQYSCTRQNYEGAVKIREMKRIAVEKGWEEYKAGWAKPEQTSSKQAAVIGAGPAGLASALFLARAGMPVMVFEKEPNAGGIVKNVIPQFRLPEGVIQQDIDFVADHGVQFEFNCKANLNVNDLKASGFDYVILGVGAEKGNPIRLEGEGGQVIKSLDFLRSFNKAETKDCAALNIGSEVAVVGGGNTAMDSARAALKVDGVKKVTVFYRRTENEMPADREEYENAVKDGVEFCFLSNPETMTESELTCRTMTLGEPDEKGHRRPVASEETTTHKIDTLISAIGERADVEMLQAMGIPMAEDGWPKLSEQGETEVEGVFLAGDAATGPSSIVSAIQGGRKAADAIMVRECISAETFSLPEGSHASAVYDKKGMIPLAELTPGDDQQLAAREASRCLECNHICTKCADVCPNRANIAVPVPGFKDPVQILHLDAYCNECGNCASFCSYSSAPYKTKMTIFSLQEDFDNSTNTGFLVTDDKVQVRFGEETFNLTIDAESQLTGERPEAANDLCKVITHIHREYRYLLGHVIP